MSLCLAFCVVSSHSFVSDCDPGQCTRLLCPLEFSNKNTGVSSLPSRMLPDPGVKPGFLPWQADANVPGVPLSLSILTCISMLSRFLPLCGVVCAHACVFPGVGPCVCSQRPCTATLASLQAVLSLAFLHADLSPLCSALALACTGLCVLWGSPGTLEALTWLLTVEASEGRWI